MQGECHKEGYFYPSFFLFINNQLIMPTKEQIRKSVLKEVTQEENRIFAIMFVIFFTAFMIMSMFEGMMGKKTYAILFFAFALVCAVIGSIAFLNSGEWKRRKK